MQTSRADCFTVSCNSFPHFWSKDPLVETKQSLQDIWIWRASGFIHQQTVAHQQQPHSFDIQQNGASNSLPLNTTDKRKEKKSRQIKKKLYRIIYSPREVRLSISFPSQVMPWKVTDNHQMPDQGVPLKGVMRAMQKPCFRTQKRHFTR